MGPFVSCPQLHDQLKSIPETQGEVQYLKLFRLLRKAITLGELAPGCKLPSSRGLASDLGVARNTVKTAYEMLIAEGYVESRVGAGSFVASIPGALLKLASKAETVKYAPDIPLSEYAQQFMALAPLNSDIRLKLQPAIPALDQFPLVQWKRCLSYASSFKALESIAPEGDRELRQQIASLVSNQRGIDASPEQVLITSGSQQAAYLTVKLLLNPGERVYIETPGFPGTSGIMASSGCKLIPINLEQGDKLEKSARMISLTPSRNFPLGHTLPLEQRLKVIQWAEQNNSWILEDDYDSEFALGRSVSALFSISESDRVIYTGTFSRSMFPALRLGYMVVPRALKGVFSSARRYMDGGLSKVVQIAMAQFMEQGFYARHLKRMRQFYRTRETFIKSLIADTALSELPIIDAGGGMHAVIELPDAINDQLWVKELNAMGLGVRALSGYTRLGPKMNGLVIGYCADSEADIIEGINKIVSSYSKMKRSG